MEYPREVKRSGRRRVRANDALVAFILKHVVALESMKYSLVVEAIKISAAGETVPVVHVPRIESRRDVTRSSV